MKLTLRLLFIWSGLEIKVDKLSFSGMKFISATTAARAQLELLEKSVPQHLLVPAMNSGIQAETFRLLRSLIYQFSNIYKSILARLGQKFRF